MAAPKTQAPTVPTVQGLAEQSITEKCNIAGAVPDRKVFANVQEALALKGYALLKLHDGTLLIERWGYSRTVDGITQAAQFLAQIGAHHG